MAVSPELLCSFELLKPLDSTALKNHIKKGRKERMNTLNSPVGPCCLSLVSVCVLIVLHSLRTNIRKVTRMPSVYLVEALWPTTESIKHFYYRFIWLCLV